MTIEKRIELIEAFYQLDLDKLNAKRRSMSGAEYEAERRIVDENRFYNLLYARRAEDRTL